MLSDEIHIIVNFSQVSFIKAFFIMHVAEGTSGLSLFSLKYSVHLIVTYTLNYFPCKGPKQEEEVKNSQQEFSSRESRGSIIPSQLIRLGKTSFTGIKAQSPAVG